MAAIRAQGGQAQALVLDVSDADAVQAAAKTVLATHGRIDQLICSAGGNVPNRYWNALTPEAFAKVVSVNLNGVAYGVGAVLPAMRAAGRGSIVVVSSWAGWRYLTFTGAAYGASKAAMTNLTRVAALEFGGDKIRVNAVLPGGTATEGAVAASKDMVQRGLELKGPMTQPGRVPLGMMGNPADIAAACLFFASPASKQVTGQSLAVDGGFLVS